MAPKIVGKSGLPLDARLVEAAENLFGVNGLEAVSLRQISLAAGTGNNFAVQYHFGDQDGLIRAILEKRMPEVERRRAQYLARVKADGRLDETRALMDVLYRPVFESQNSRGERAFARFVLALQNSLAHSESEAFEYMPVAEHVVGLIERLHPDIPPALLLERQRLVSIMALTSIVNRRPPFTDRHDEALILNVLDMATAALTAPVARAIRKAI